MSPRHQRLRAALQRLQETPDDAGLATTIDLEFRRPTRTAPRNGGHAMPERALSSTRVAVARTDPERRLTPVTQVQLKEYAHLCGGVAGIGRSLEEQRRERAAYVREFALRMICGGIVAASMLWFAGVLVRIFWTP